MNARHRSGGEPETAPESPDAGAAEPTGAGVEVEPGVSGAVAEPKPRPRIRRRVTTQAVPGSDPHPAPEPKRHVPGENDAQLKRDVPPHWG